MEIETIVTLECVCKINFSFDSVSGASITYKRGQKVFCEFSSTGVTVRSSRERPRTVTMERRIWDKAFETKCFADEIRSRLIEKKN